MPGQCNYSCIFFEFNKGLAGYLLVEEFASLINWSAYFGTFLFIYSQAKFYNLRFVWNEIEIEQLCIIFIIVIFSFRKYLCLMNFIFEKRTIGSFYRQNSLSLSLFLGEKTKFFVWTCFSAHFLYPEAVGISVLIQ